MHDYQNDDSLMARIQRENAKEKLNKFDNKLIKLALPTFVVILLFVSIIFGAGLTTVSALASKGVIKTGQEIIGEVIPVIINQYEVSYEVDGEGEILGDMFQVVQEGESTTEVEALAMDGWVFVGWSDNFDEIIRQELDVHQNLSFTAIFQELDETDQGEDGGDGNEEGEPSDEEREGEPRGDNTSDQVEKNGDPSEEPGSGEGGKYESQNQVIDGQTYYGESTYDAAYESAMDSLQQDSGMSDGEKSIIGEYFSTIEK